MELHVKFEAPISDEGGRFFRYT